MTNASNTQSDSALDKARTTASHALETSRETLQTNPLAMIAGGLALGAVAGAAIPRSEREKELLKPVGKRLAGAAVMAATAAREAGMAELDKRGLTKDAVREQAKGAVDGLGQALSSAGSAAAKNATVKPEA